MANETILMERALGVIALNPQIRAWLEANDPKALEQVMTALKVEAPWILEPDHSGPCHACARHLGDTMARCPGCGYDGNLGRFTDEPDENACTNPLGHSFYRTGTAFGGDDERWGGEGRSFCRHCGADGDA